jgi:hypothetical protein
VMAAHPDICIRWTNSVDTRVPLQRFCPALSTPLHGLHEMKPKDLRGTNSHLIGLADTL